MPEGADLTSLSNQSLKPDKHSLLYHKDTAGAREGLQWAFTQPVWEAGETQGSLPKLDDLWKSYLALWFRISIIPRLKWSIGLKFFRNQKQTKSKVYYCIIVHLLKRLVQSHWEGRLKQILGPWCFSGAGPPGFSVVLTLAVQRLYPEIHCSETLLNFGRELYKTKNFKFSFQETPNHAVYLLKAYFLKSLMSHRKLYYNL